jgi:hypothetical protein
MPKIITAKRQEGESEKANEFVRTYILMPSSLLGLIAMVVGVLALGYQLLAGTYGWETFLYSSGLLVCGVLLGIGHTKYQQYLLREFPGYFANRMKTYAQRSLHKAKKTAADVEIEHRGRGLIPLCYVLGIGLLLGLSGLSVSTGFLDGLPAFFLPWAGYFWAKLFFWKGLVLAPRTKKS